ncbi:MAG: hypothetical protein CL661_05420 [Bacteroidetes bacterium]|jgi:predicted cupin superfamily sugar epimerase|nr:hypothetical protein [Bacteroidota bacterium]|tara:strand:+ start:688 stop:1197 length:510 start_codon:yes stop_codon:yes gene_type:complete
MRNAQYWIKNLDLIPHKEGGYFREVYRSHEQILKCSLPDRFTDNKVFSTSIYFMLEKSDFSAFHKIKSDEIWHYYDGDPITIYVIDNNGKLNTYQLGLSPENNIMPQITIYANQWFAAETMGDFSLVGCTVSPGFDFHDFEIAERNELIGLYKEHRKIIEQFTRSSTVN